MERLEHPKKSSHDQLQGITTSEYIHKYDGIGVPCRYNLPICFLEKETTLWIWAVTKADFKAACGAVNEWEDAPNRAETQKLHTSLRDKATPLSSNNSIWGITTNYTSTPCYRSQFFCCHLLYRYHRKQAASVIIVNDLQGSLRLISHTSSNHFIIPHNPAAFKALHSSSDLHKENSPDRLSTLLGAFFQCN
ncbi:hypothetical protein PIB30_082896 [Stylosanthes scabra]|uniref:Uncharacterized protein n=1 Tax=Stylosanthes scabra TaxID=79078 RepID=A0ABU6WVD4_9FABA|nr:hypothetical protein [Stylosanthes scabra]